MNMLIDLQTILNKIHQTVMAVRIKVSVSRDIAPRSRVEADDGRKWRL